MQRWVYRYRDGGLAALHAIKQYGKSPKLSPEREAEFTRRFLGGPTAADGEVCTLRGRDACRILAAEFGVKHSPQGAYDVMHRLGLSPLKPRPRHRKNEPAAMT